MYFCRVVRAVQTHCPLRRKLGAVRAVRVAFGVHTQAKVSPQRTGSTMSHRLRPFVHEGEDHLGRWLVR